VAPRAKMNQQRNRRFKNANEESNNGFDKNSITPGTKFMEDLSKSFKEFISDKIKNDDKWKSVKVIYSGYDVPGEGEHKIINDIRNSNCKKHCIYGRDSDLILLGLLLCGSNPNLNIRIISTEEFTFEEKSKVFELKLLSTLRKNLEQEFKGFNIKEFNIKSIIKDFLLLVLFVGNDFIPKLSNININNKGLDLIILIYKEVLNKNGYINKDKGLNIKGLEMIFEKLSVIERGCSIDDYLNSFETQQQDELNNRFPKLQTIKEDKDQKILIKKYIKGLYWVIAYYNGIQKSYRWFYPRCKSLLPDAYQDLMNDPRIKEYYPINSDNNLSFINEERLLSVLEFAENKLTEEEKWRNKFRVPLSYNTEI
ncbi:10193_t:CDS:2, partial [Scutellospora calospora]